MHIKRVGSGVSPPNRMRDDKDFSPHIIHTDSALEESPLELRFVFVATVIEVGFDALDPLAVSPLAVGITK